MNEHDSQGQEGAVPAAELPGAAAGHGRVPGAAPALSPPAEGRAQGRRRRQGVQRGHRRRKVSRVSGGQCVYCCGSPL